MRTLLVALLFFFLITPTVSARPPSIYKPQTAKQSARTARALLKFGVTPLGSPPADYYRDKKARKEAYETKQKELREAYKNRNKK